MITVNHVVEALIVNGQTESSARQNAEAFMRMATAFDCLESDSYDEAHKKLLITLVDIGEELDGSVEGYARYADRMEPLRYELNQNNS